MPLRRDRHSRRLTSLLRLLLLLVPSSRKDKLVFGCWRRERTFTLRICSRVEMCAPPTQHDGGTLTQTQTRKRIMIENEGITHSECRLSLAECVAAAAAATMTMPTTALAR